MGTRLVYDDATEAYQHPRLVRLGPNLYAVCFTLMKMIPARYILCRALGAGQLEPETLIVETTSGTFGLALAMQAAQINRRLILVSDSVIDERLYRRLTDLGAVVERVPQKAAVGGYQTARLDRVAQIRADHPATFCPEQYSNPDNPRSYAIVAELLVEALGQIDCVVGPVGSGGSICGTTTYLRSVFPDCRAIGVDTHCSVLFGHPNGDRELRGLGNSLMPQNLDHCVFDSVHWCNEVEVCQATRQLHQRHALFMGPTSGAAYLVGRWWARTNPDLLTVMMMPDEGYRYLDTVYDDKWLAAQGYSGTELPYGPLVVDDSTQPGTRWTAYDWGRRSYAEVMAAARGRPADVR
jgi:cysteine synthase